MFREHPTPIAAACVAALTWCAGAPAAAGAEVHAPHYDIEAPSVQIAKAKQRELEWSAALFEDLFSLAPPRGKVILSDTPGAQGTPPMAGATGGGAKWTLPWFTGMPPGMPQGMGAQLKALTHEAAHLQLLHLVNDGCAPDLKKRFNGYGSYLPDWVDEAVAVYHEPDGQKKERRVQLKASLRDHIPFATYFTMDHPLGANGGRGLPPGLMPPAGGGVGGGAVPNSPGLERANIFYVQSLGVIEYLVAVGGKPFFRFCVARLQHGAAMDAVLAEWHARFKEIKKLIRRARRRPWSAADAAKLGKGAQPRAATSARKDEAAALWPLLRPRKGERVGRLPRDVEALEADWVRWIERRYPGYRPRLPRFPE